VRGREAGEGDVEDGEVIGGIGADEAGGVGLAGGERDRQRLRTRDDVGI
jgi:hypothetical protein